MGSLANHSVARGIRQNPNGDNPPLCDAPGTKPRFLRAERPVAADRDQIISFRFGVPCGGLLQDPAQDASAEKSFASAMSLTFEGTQLPPPDTL